MGPHQARPHRKCPRGRQRLDRVICDDIAGQAAHALFGRILAFLRAEQPRTAAQLGPCFQHYHLQSRTGAGQRRRKASDPAANHQQVRSKVGRPGGGAPGAVQRMQVVK